MVVHTLNDDLASSIMASTERLPWGSLPLETYVLAHWASHPTDDLDTRRRQLAQQYVALGYRGHYVSLRHRFDFVKGFL